MARVTPRVAIAKPRGTRGGPQDIAHLAGMIHVGWAKTASPDGGPAQTHRLADRAAQSATDLVKRSQAHRRSGLRGPPGPSSQPRTRWPNS